MKICTKCKIEKEDTEFRLSRYKRKSDGVLSLNSSCKKCESKDALERYKNKEDLTTHKIKKRIYDRNRKIELRKDPFWRLKNNISRSVCKYVNNTNSKKGGRKTEEIIGVEIEQIRIHLEKHFKPGMTWDNYGEWHIDHIKPQCLFDFTNPEEIKECWNIDNLQPLWASENLSKGGKYFG
jgi:hypothetical protein